jgi:cell wall-associated NlpC family hydrolase
MTSKALQLELALWRRRHQFRQRELDVAHQKNNAKAIKHWHARLVEAGRKIQEIEQELAKKVHVRDRVSAVVEQAALNYRRNPGAYHYLAGGVPNLEIMRPTPSTWRSDCSQFAVNAYRLAGAACPGTGTFLYSNTDSISMGGRVTQNPQPGDLGLYGSGRGRTHHVEVKAKGHLIGHGSPPIDSLTPGLPDFYLSFLPT